MQSLRAIYRLPPGNGFDLSQISPQNQGPFADSEEGKRFLESAIEEIQRLQYKLFTETKQSLLIVLQAPDAAGKDGAIRHVLGKMNPQGCRAYSFKAPNDLEASHDFLWRIHTLAPAAGMVSIFNRSHYEDVLVARVESLVPESIWRRRYDHINAFESLLMDRGTRILKFYLHISPEEQLKRFGQRLDDPEKHWKLNIGDYTARSKWTAYRLAYQEVFERCSPEAAPWFIIPADRKWHRNAAIAGILLETLRDMNPRIPAPTVDPAEVRKHFEAAKVEAGRPTATDIISFPD